MGEIRVLSPVWASFIVEHQTMYPDAMHEDEATFRRLLEGGHCLGCIDEDEQPRLLGWILFEVDQPTETRKTPMIYCYDLAVLPTHQREGIGRQLWVAAARELRWRGFWIRAHCRRQSYELLTSAPGYVLVWDHFIENHYAKEYDDSNLIGEHAHEILLKPMGYK
jgi:GNAT superfamily N-acetyltransferase